MVSKRRLWQLKRFKTGHGREKALGWRVQTLSLQGPGWAHSEVTALFPIYTVTSPWRRDPGGCLGHVNTHPPQRRKDPLLLSSHIHLPLDWNSFILFKWFILFHWDLISKAVPSAKRLCQQVSNHFFFFFSFSGWWEFQVWNMSRFFYQQIFLSSWSTVLAKSFIWVFP